MKHIPSLFLAGLLGVGGIACALTGERAEHSGATMETGNFAGDLWRNVPQGVNRNRLVSPFSVRSALLLLLEGARGETRKRIEQTLRLSGADEKDVLAAAHRLNVDLMDSGEIQIANAVFVAPEVRLAPNYLQRVKSTLGATAERLQSGSAATAQINGWVKEKTKGRIPRLVDRVDPSTTAVLMNAITFDGKWQKPFNSERTQPRPFQTSAGAKSTPMMGQVESFGYLEREGDRIAVLPYAGGKTAMIVALPAEGHDPSSVLAKVDPTWIGSVLHEASSQRLDLWLPKFRFEDTPNVQTALQKMGLAPLFRSGDFRAMAPNGEVSRISQIVHKTMVDVDEQGTKAAAATGIIMTRSARPAGKPIAFHLDRPFAFAIVHEPTRTPIFLGAVNRL